MGSILFIIGAIGLAVVFPPIIFVYLLLLGAALMDGR